MDVDYIALCIQQGLEYRIREVEKLGRIIVESFIEEKKLYISIKSSDGSAYSEKVTKFFNNIGMEETMLAFDDWDRTFVGKF